MNSPFPPNRFKRDLQSGRPVIGLWSSLCNNLSMEVIAGAGFDWILIDGEHAPNELQGTLSQLQAASQGTAAPVIRPAWNDFVLIKRYLDIGAQNLLIPYVQTAEEARAAVAATRYPPQGIRGVAVLVRANQYGRHNDYIQKVNQEICVLLQIETRQAVDNLEAIAAVEGVDGLFIGPSDLAAAFGHLGKPGDPAMREVTEKVISRILKTGKAAGILTPVETDARHWLERGCTVVAVGSDLGLLARHSEALAARFKESLKK